MVEEPYQFSSSCVFVRVDHFRAERKAQRYRWHKTESSSLCYRDGTQPLLWCHSRGQTHYHYQDDLLQKEVTYSPEGREILRETEYEYDSRRRVRLERASQPGGRLLITNFAYDEQDRVCSKHAGAFSSRYHYNKRGELVLQQDYRQDRLTVIHRKAYVDGFLVSHDEVRPNGQLLRRHCYRRGDKGVLLAYSLVSGKKIVLKQLAFFYPAFYRDDWLEQIVVQLRRKRNSWERVPVRRLRRSCCYPVATGSLG